MSELQPLIVIGIAGPSGSGKSLLSRTIVDEIGSDEVTVITEDAYYKEHPGLTLAELREINYDHPDAFDHELLAKHLQQLKNGQSIQVPIYDHANYCRTGKTRRISSSHRIIVLEGVLLLSDAKLKALMDIKVYVDTPLDLCFIRRLRRDVIERGRTVESVIQQYEKTVRPMFLTFNEPTRRDADLIVPRGGKNRIAIDLIQSKIKALLTQHEQTSA